MWGRDEYINNTKYALNIIPQAFQFFEEYFDIKEVVKKSGWYLLTFKFILNLKKNKIRYIKNKTILPRLISGKIKIN